MIQIRPAQERGHGDHGWLNSQHTFSFANYYDPNHMGFASLRVINEDRVEPGRGFGTHPHNNMEIVSYVLSGALEHKDSMGNGSVMKPGDVQRMSAGTGVAHSEYNHSKKEPVHFLQIWFMPKEQDIKPSYEQQFFPKEEKQNRLRLVVSPNGENRSVSINQDVYMYAGLIDDQTEVVHRLKPGRKAWVHLAKGELDLNGRRLNAGDGAAITDLEDIVLSKGKDAEVILFDMADYPA